MQKKKEKNLWTSKEVVEYFQKNYLTSPKRMEWKQEGDWNAKEVKFEDLLHDALKAHEYREFFGKMEDIVDGLIEGATHMETAEALITFVLDNMWKVLGTFDERDPLK